MIVLHAFTESEPLGHLHERQAFCAPEETRGRTIRDDGTGIVTPFALATPTDERRPFDFIPTTGLTGFPVHLRRRTYRQILYSPQIHVPLALCRGV